MDYPKLLRDFEPARAAREMERKFYAKLDGTFASVVARAVMAETNTPGKMNSHQRRVGREKLREFLAAVEPHVVALRRADSFEQILDLLAGARIAGVGALTLFDTALRIGFHRNLLPGRVYLQAGSRKGAALLAPPIRGLSAPVDEFPRPLRRLPPYQLEHFLCVMASELGRPTRRRAASMGRRPPGC